MKACLGLTKKKTSQGTDSERRVVQESESKSKERTKGGNKRKTSLRSSTLADSNHDHTLHTSSEQTMLGAVSTLCPIDFVPATKLSTTIPGKSTFAHRHSC